MLDCSTLFGFYPSRRADISLDALLRVIEKHGVQKALTLSAKSIFYDFAEGNDETLEACRSHPDVLAPTFSVNLFKYLGVRDEVRKRAEQGFKLCRVFPDIQGWPVDFLPFARLLDDLEEAGLPLAISGRFPGTLTQLSRLVEGHSFPIIVADLTYVSLGEALTFARENPRVYIESFSHNATDALEVLVDQLGEKRVIFGSSAPLFPFSAAILQVKHSGLTPGQQARILEHNLLEALERR